MRSIVVADYFVEFLLANKIKDVFAYQGGMVAHLFDSLGKYRDRMHLHTFGNEQGAALAACAYAQATGKPGVVVTTSGPGFTNMLTGIANAWFDSIPLICIAGQVNTKDKKRLLPIRQYGFQETQSCDMAKSITKATFEIDNDTDIVSCFDEAYRVAMTGRKGPVFLDFPINIGRNIIEVSDVIAPIFLVREKNVFSVQCLDDFLQAERPLILAGAGIKQSGMKDKFREFAKLANIPVITSMPAMDILPSDDDLMLGYIGGTAKRASSIALANCNYLLVLGDRMPHKQIGYDLLKFAPKAKLIRVDIDDNEFSVKAKDNEIQIKADLREFIPAIAGYDGGSNYNHSVWNRKCLELKYLLADVDSTFGNKVVEAITKLLPEDANIVLDVGNNMVYGTQSGVVNSGTNVFASCGLGSMGYSIPAAIGVNIGNGKVTCSINGDGGALMNIQELNTIAHMKKPIKVVVLNNRALGHIILFQEHYLENRFVGTREQDGDFYSCDFAKVANAFGLRSYKIKDLDDIGKYKDVFCDDKPALFEVEFENCPMLPNIHAGDNYILSGPKLSDDVIAKIGVLMA